jgi:hypothetical protein
MSGSNIRAARVIPQPVLPHAYRKINVPSEVCRKRALVQTALLPTSDRVAAEGAAL